MTKRNQFILLLLLLATAALIFYFSRHPYVPETTEKNILPQGLTTSKVEVNGRPVVGLPPGREDEEAAKMKITNIPSPDWEENVEKFLRAQGGDALKSVNIITLDSFIWHNQGLALNVESILISLTNQRDEETKFRALVDSETGKILHTWDQPVFDPINPREKRGVKIDPRYFE